MRKIMLSPVALDLRTVRSLSIAQPAWDTKPTGLWYSCGNEWADWLRNERGEDPRERYRYAYELELDERHIWRIRDNASFDHFQASWGAPVDAHSPYDITIAWQALSVGVAGIEICPYLWDRKRAYWYYSWDIASGCIWRGDCVVGLREVEIE